MTFFAKDRDEIFEIEKSKLLKSMGQGVKTVEFIMYTGNRIRFIEAKESAPNSDNKEDFDEYIEMVFEKFVHSMDLFFAVLLNRKEDNHAEVSERIKFADMKTTNIILLLVIKSHPDKALLPITEALKRSLRRHMKTWNLDVLAINYETALKWKLVKKAAT